MSDESDFDDDALDSPNPSTPGISINSDDPKRHARAQHNALERRRRDNIKDMYTSLKDTVPEMQNERASRAVILRRAIDSIDEKTAKHNQIQAECEHFRKENAQLEEEIRLLREQGGSEHVQTTVPRTPFVSNSSYLKTSFIPPHSVPQCLDGQVPTTTITYKMMLLGF